MAVTYTQCRTDEQQIRLTGSADLVRSPNGQQSQLAALFRVVALCQLWSALEPPHRDVKCATLQLASTRFDSRFIDTNGRMFVDRLTDWVMSVRGNHGSPAGLPPSAGRLQSFAARLVMRLATKCQMESYHWQITSFLPNQRLIMIFMILWQITAHNHALIAANGNDRFDKVLPIV